MTFCTDEKCKYRKRKYEFAGLEYASTENISIHACKYFLWRLQWNSYWLSNENIMEHNMILHRHTGSKFKICNCFMPNCTRNLSSCSWDVQQHQFNFICMLSWYVSSNFSENSFFKCASQPEIAKNSLKPYIFRFDVVQGHRRWYPRKLVSSACSDKQQVCVYLQPFSP